MNSVFSFLGFKSVGEHHPTSQPVEIAHETVKQQITKIGVVLNKAKEHDRVVIKQLPNFEVTYGYHHHQLWPDSFITAISLTSNVFDSYKKENRDTIDYFYKIFGKSRVQNISQQFQAEIETKRNHDLPITKGDIERIFAGVAIIYKEELGQFFTELKRTEPQKELLHLSSDDVKTLKNEIQQFQQKSFDDLEFDDLNNQSLKKLYAAMIPFDSIETIFLGNLPEKPFTGSANPKKNFHDFQRLVYTTEKLRREALRIGEKDLASLKTYKLKHRIRMTKKLMNNHLPSRKVLFEISEKIVFDTPKGLLYKFALLEAGGAFTIAMKTFKTEPDKKFHSCLYFLPTQALNCVPQPWESVVDDLQKEIGALGAKAIYPKITDEILEPTAKFVERDEKIDILGYSLGGNQAIRIATLLYPTGILRKVFITSNPGIDKKTAALFKTLVDQKRFPIKLSYSCEADDYTAQYGECHLGLNTDPQLVKIRYRYLISKIKSDQQEIKDYTASEILNFPTRRKCHISGLRMISMLAKALNTGHSRESYYVEGFKEHSLRNYSKKGEDLTEEDLEIRNKYLHRVVLENVDLGFEQQRQEILKSMTGMIPASFLKEGDSEESNSFEIFAKNSLAQKGLLQQ